MRYSVSLRIPSKCGKIRTRKLQIWTLFAQCIFSKQRITEKLLLSENELNYRDICFFFRFLVSALVYYNFISKQIVYENSTHGVSWSGPCDLLQAPIINPKPLLASLITNFKNLGWIREDTKGSCVYISIVSTLIFFGFMYDVLLFKWQNK